METVKLAGCIIMNEEARVLLLHRRAAGEWPGTWEIPGGKVEPDEEPEAAAVREAHEELGIRVRIAGKMGSTVFRHAGNEYSYEWFRAHIDSGTPAIDEPDLFDDLAYHDLRRYDIGRIGLSPAAEKFAWALHNNELQVY